MTALTQQLSEATGLREALIVRIMASAPVRYKQFFISKRDGGKRLIAQPAREVKALQRAFTDVLLNNLPVHAAATAYRQGMSIKDNAMAHAGTGPILKMDFRDYFPSIRRRDWIAYCNHTGCLEGDDIQLSALLLFRRTPGLRDLRLAIGAPSSPAVSNILMYDFDQKLTDKLANDQVIYSRYADDLTFSAKRTGHLTVVEKNVRLTLKEIDFPRLKVNATKTVRATTKFRRVVTGLTLANDGRVTVGKRRKRLLHAAVHKASLNALTAEQMQRLAGHLAFVNSVEPEFLEALGRRYGAELIARLLKFVVFKRLGKDDK